MMIVGDTMIRSILLVLAEGPGDVSAKSYAFWLAGKEGSRIHALSLIDIAAFEVPVLGTPDGFMPPVVTAPLQEGRAMLNEMNALAKERLDAFAAQCAAKGIPCTAEVKIGAPGETIYRAAAAHDIVVIARTGYSHATHALESVDPMVTHAIRNSVRPVLVAGSGFQETSELRNILVAYDGSPHASRALLAAVGLAARPGVECTLLAVAASDNLGKETLAPAEAFLIHHDITPKKQVVVSAKPSEVICGLAASSAVDIVIMGAYGHSPIREVLFGSTTERVLANCAATVILQS
jgi:nucleotide-binding universal stress UspA family protein